MDSEIEMLKKQVKIMHVMICLLFAAIACGVALAIILGFKSKELNVERINIREADGTIKMVLSNKSRQHPGRMNGKDNQAREREAGLIFFNTDGDECGGLVYDNDRKSAGMAYSIDKFRDDQIMQLQYMEDTRNKKRKYGLQFWTYGKEDAFGERGERYQALLKLKSRQDRDSALKKMENEGLLATDRMFIGKTFRDELGLFISDERGRPRIRIYVTKDNRAVMETIDESGKVQPADNGLQLP